MDRTVKQILNVKNIAQTLNFGLRSPETPRSRRHGAPAGPWPWKDFSDLQPEQSSTVIDSPQLEIDPQKQWKNYPRSLFPNWTHSQVERSKIAQAIHYTPAECIIHYADISTHSSIFTSGEMLIKRGGEDTFINVIQAPPSYGVTIRALFLNKPSGPVLQILGTRYKIEPFFFSSSLNWIPTRYRETIPKSNGDRITIVLPFVSVVSRRTHDGYQGGFLPASDQEDLILVHEILAVHMIRSSSGNTIISFHSNDNRSTASLHLRSRIIDAGSSVYWANILKTTHDPAFVLLIYMWYAMYAWDQALEQLYVYISKLERRTTSDLDTEPSQTLHNIHAHLLSYASMLRDFKKSVEFILETSDTTKNYDEEEQLMMRRECGHLISEIERLDLEREIHTERLKNGINLLFSSVNLSDSEQMRRLTQVTVRDSRAMKQISILTMIFLPASFAASVFGMNITALSADPQIKGTLEHYVETAIPLTLITIWFIVASQIDVPGTTFGSQGWQRLAWPYTTLRKILVPETGLDTSLTEESRLNAA